MTYVIAQLCGIGATICSFGSLLKKKWQMLVISLVASALTVINLILLGQIGSAVFMNGVAIVQISLSLWHVLKVKPVTKTEKIIFVIIYMAFGLIGANNALDIMPLIGTFFFVLSVFIMNEQKTRMYIVANTGVYMIYYAIIGSTLVFAALASTTINLTAFLAYRKKFK